MSRLEEQARPLLLSMHRGSTRTYYEAGKTTLASWFVKTARIEGSKFEPLLPQEFYRELYRDERPSDRTVVWLAATPYREQHYADFRPIRVHPDDSPPPLEPNSYSAVVSLGFVVGFVVSWLEREPSQERLLHSFSPGILQLWPAGAEPATWPPDYRLDFAGLDRLSDAIVSEDEVSSGRGRPNG